MSTKNFVNKNMKCIICLDLIDIEKQYIEIDNFLSEQIDQFRIIRHNKSHTIQNGIQII